jgi:hypothetical protein
MSRSLNVRPVLTSSNQGDKGFGYIVLRRNSALRHPGDSPNSNDIGRGELRCGTASCVLSWGNWLQMGRVDAPSVSTEMIELHTVGYRADQFLVDPPVSVPPALSVSDRTVTGGIQSEIPIPATSGRINRVLRVGVGTIGAHVTSPRDVPRRRVFLAPLRLSVLSQQLYQTGGAPCL